MGPSKDFEGNSANKEWEIERTAKRMLAIFCVFGLSSPGAHWMQHSHSSNPDKVQDPKAPCGCARINMTPRARFSNFCVSWDATQGIYKNLCPSRPRVMSFHWPSQPCSSRLLIKASLFPSIWLLRSHTAGLCFQMRAREILDSSSMGFDSSLGS